MKRFFSIILVVLMVLSFGACSAQENSDEIKVIVNGEKVEFDQPPVIIDGRTLVPIRKICEAIGAEVYYDKEVADRQGIQIVSIIKDNILVAMVEGYYGIQESPVVGPWRINKYDIPEEDYEYVSLYNYDTEPMEVQPTIINGRTCVPVRVITEYLGGQVDWIEESKTVKIEIEPSKPLRRQEEIEKKSSFTVEQAEVIVNEIWSYPELYYEGPATFGRICFNKNGRVFPYHSTGTAIIYPDYTVDIFDWETGELLKTVEFDADEINEKVENRLPFRYKELYFSSGTGGWGTSLRLEKDGDFIGTFQDSNWGETGIGYPEGTVETCKFRGNFSNIKKIDEHTYTMTLDEITFDNEPGETWIKNGIKYVATTPYGIEDGREFRLYTPEKSTEGFSEEFLMWRCSPYGEYIDELAILGKYGLHNVKMDYGFFAD